MKARAAFITFEGIEGSGKSSQLAVLARYLRRNGLRVLATREPGGTPAGDAIRSLVLGTDGSGLDPWSELFLMEAARAQHLAQIVRPALAEGTIVLCDRFTDSTLAYQGYGRRLPLDTILRLHRLPALGPVPDLTILLDLPIGTGLARVVKRRTGAGSRVRRRENRIDEEPRAFHERVRYGYMAIARREPRRVVKIDASGGRLTIARAVRAVVASRFGLH